MRWIMLLLCCFFLTACGSGGSVGVGSTEVLESITVTAAATPAKVYVGNPKQFTAMARYSNGGRQDISALATWTSSDSGVATTPPGCGGVATVTGAGTATIKASYKGVSGETILTVSLPWKSVVAGPGFSAGIRLDGTLWTWGNNVDGQLGDGTRTTKTVPMQIGTSTDWKSVALGTTHVVAVMNDGSLWTWGDNSLGQLGDGTTVNRLIPTRVGLAGWKAVSAGDYFSIGIQTDGTLWTWGSNWLGQLGDGTKIDQWRPKKIGTASNWKSVSAGAYHSIASKEDGSLWAWGDNSDGQRGDGTTDLKPLQGPTRIGTDNNWTSISAGWSHSFAINNGALWAWGWGKYGQTGNGRNDAATPTPVLIGNGWAVASAGYMYSFALKADGTLWWWGRITDISWDKNIPTQFGTVNNWVSVSNCTNHTLALKPDGSLWAWGNNGFGQLGDGILLNNWNPKMTF